MTSASRSKNSTERAGRIHHEWVLTVVPHGAIVFQVDEYPADSSTARILGGTHHATDIGVHRSTPDPERDWMTPMDCCFVEGTCWYDGTGLGADELWRRCRHASDPDAVIWAELESWAAEWLTTAGGAS